MLEIKSTDALEACLAESALQPVLLFKHSTTCPISAAAYRRVTDYLEEAGEDAPPCYLVKVIESRPVSNAIAEYLGVRHQSPQTILVHRGEACWDASHGTVTGDAIRRVLADLNRQAPGRAREADG